MFLIFIFESINFKTAVKLSRNQDGPKTFWVETETKTET